MIKNAKSLRRIARELDMTGTELATVSGVDQSDISKGLNGRRIFTADENAKIQMALDRKMKTRRRGRQILPMVDGGHSYDMKLKSLRAVLYELGVSEDHFMRLSGINKQELAGLYAGQAVSADFVAKAQGIFDKFIKKKTDDDFANGNEAGRIIWDANITKRKEVK